MLGVVLSLERAFAEGVANANKLERVRSVIEQAREILDRQTLPPAESAALRGRVSFADQQCTGRCGAMATRALGRRAAQHGGSFVVTLDLRRALHWIVAHLGTAPPRIVPVTDIRAPVVIH